MPFWSKSRAPEGEEARIASFWSWWAEARDGVAEGIANGGVDDETVAVISRQVDAVAPGLAWELMAGGRAQHALVVSPEGDPELRALAHRLWLAAPEPDPTFEYHASRPADPSGLTQSLALDSDMGDHPVTLDLGALEVALEVDDDRRLVDVRVHHPAFAGLAERQRVQVAFLSLDWLLGEEDVERWIGAIDAEVQRPPGARPISDLAEVIEELRARGSDAEGRLLSFRRDDGREVLVSVYGPLKPVDWPVFDTHARVEVAFPPDGENGWPEPDTLASLRAFEDGLVDQLGDDGVLAAHETVDGRRTFHLYVDGNANAPARLSAGIERSSSGPAELHVERDAAWNAVRPFR